MPSGAFFIAFSRRNAYFCAKMYYNEKNGDSGEIEMKKLAFGLMRLPLLNKNDATSIDIERVKGMADAFIEEGFTYFDTAAPYHNKHSEIAFREAVVKRYPREAYTITDKLSLGMIEKAEDMENFFEGQHSISYRTIDSYYISNSYFILIKFYCYCSILFFNINDYYLFTWCSTCTTVCCIT